MHSVILARHIMALPLAGAMIRDHGHVLALEREALSALRGEAKTVVIHRGGGDRSTVHRCALGSGCD